MRNKIIFKSSDFDELTGISCVKLECNNHTYRNFAFTHPEEEYVSHLFGCELAEIRCVIDIYKDNLKQQKNDYETLINFIKSCRCDKRWDNESPMAKAIYHQLNLSEKRIAQTKEEIQKLQDCKKHLIENRDIEINDFNAGMKKIKQND